MRTAETGRNFIGIEREEEYMEIASKRIDNAKTMKEKPSPMELNFDD